jgi:hypothetical protein
LTDSHTRERSREPGLITDGKRSTFQGEIRLATFESGKAHFGQDTVYRLRRRAGIGAICQTGDLWQRQGVHAGNSAGSVNRFQTGRVVADLESKALNGRSRRCIDRGDDSFPRFIGCVIR